MAAVVDRAADDELREIQKEYLDFLDDDVCAGLFLLVDFFDNIIQVFFNFCVMAVVIITTTLSR